MTGDPNPVVHSGVTSIRQRIELIAKRIDNSITKPQVARDGSKYMLKDFAHELVRGTPQRGLDSEIEPARACFRFARYQIEEREDPVDYDNYPSAGRVILSGAEDCDGKCILLNSLLASIGYITGARVISPDGNGWHIYSIIGVNPAFNGSPTAVLPMDARYGDDIGWEPGPHLRKHMYQCTFRGGEVVGYRRISP